MRDLTTGMTVAISSSAIRPLLLVSVALATTTLYLFTGVGTIQWNGQTWLGAGDLGKISDITETTSQSAQGVSLEFSGIDKSLLGGSLSDIKLGRPVCVYLAAVDITGALVPDPYLLFRGRVGQPTVKPSTATCTISIAAESRMDDQQRAQVSRYTVADQRQKWPLDDGLNYSAQLADSAWKWGG